ncbi:MAG: hypothetical protein IKW92_01740 [Firmicutes bacterium]|jgi:hypothetical protein|nr:hypothetical protein [Bacillota bacterium]
MNGEKVTENVYLCPDGVYRWVYEFPMLKNPAILFTVWRVLLMSCAICVLLVGVPVMFTDGLGGLTWSAKVILFTGLIIIAISVVAYLILAATFGWKYMVLFEMDDEKVVHIQMKKEVEKAEAIGWLTFMAGLATGSLTTAGSGLLAATKSTSTSIFANVKEVKANRAMHVIYVNQLLDHNQIYAEDADFDFVLQFIQERVKGAQE